MGGFGLCTTQSGNLYFRKDQQQVLRNQIDNSGTFNVEKHRNPASVIYGTTSTHRLKILLVEGINIYEDEETEG